MKNNDLFDKINKLYFAKNAKIGAFSDDDYKNTVLAEYINKDTFEKAYKAIKSYDDEMKLLPILPFEFKGFVYEDGLCYGKSFKYSNIFQSSWIVFGEKNLYIYVYTFDMKNSSNVRGELNVFSYKELTPLIIESEKIEYHKVLKLKSAVSDFAKTAIESFENKVILIGSDSKKVKLSFESCELSNERLCRLESLLTGNIQKNLGIPQSEEEQELKEEPKNNDSIIDQILMGATGKTLDEILANARAEKTQDVVSQPIAQPVEQVEQVQEIVEQPVNYMPQMGQQYQQQNMYAGQPMPQPYAQPVYAQPVQQIVQPVYAQPVQPVYAQPVQPIVQPVYTQPVMEVAQPVQAVVKPKKTAKQIVKTTSISRKPLTPEEMRLQNLARARETLQQKRESDAKIKSRKK